MLGSKILGLIAALALLLAGLSTLFASNANAGKPKPAYVIQSVLTITVDGQSPTQLGSGHNGAVFIINITTLDGSQTLKVNLQMKNPVTGSWSTITGATAHNSTGLKFACANIPTCTSTVLLDADRWGLKLPYEWRLLYDVSTDDDVTFTIGVIPFPD